MTQHRLELAGDANVGTCADCGSVTRSVWGYVYDDDGPRAAYFIRWTESHLERGAQLVVSIGKWGEQATPADRVCFAFDCRMGDDRPGFMVIDAAKLAMAQREILGVKLSREQGLAHSSRDEVFAILDRVFEADPRFRAFLASPRAS